MIKIIKPIPVFEVKISQEKSIEFLSNEVDIQGHEDNAFLFPIPDEIENGYYPEEIFVALHQVFDFTNKTERKMGYILFVPEE